MNESVSPKQIIAYDLNAGHGIRPRQKREEMRGFLPFEKRASILGTLHACRIATEGDKKGKGFFMIRAVEPCMVNVRDADCPTGQAMAQPGELVGVRKTGATKRLVELPLGTMVRITYMRFTERESLNPDTHFIENHPYHDIEILVYKEVPPAPALALVKECA